MGIVRFLIEHGPEIVHQEEEVDIVGDPALSPKVNLPEKRVNLLRSCFKTKIAKGVIQSDFEFFFIHQSLPCSLIGVPLL